MSTIEVAVAGRGIQVKQGYEKPSAGDVNTCQVSLAIESGGVWDSLPHKRVTFATRTASVTVDYAPTITIPHEVMASPGALYLTLTGYDADGIEVARTHRMTYPIEVARAGADEGAEPSPATLDVVSRIDALAERLEASEDGRDEAFQEAQSNRAASFDGSIEQWGSMVDSATSEAYNAANVANEEAKNANDSATKADEATTRIEESLDDVRTGYDGTTYATAGDAVRGQASQLYGDIGDLRKIASFTGVGDISWTNGAYISGSNGNIIENYSYNYSDYIKVPSGAKCFYRGNISGRAGIAFYDNNKTFISGTPLIENTPPYLVEDVYDIPENAAFARISQLTRNDSIAIENVIFAVNMLGKLIDTARIADDVSAVVSTVRSGATVSIAPENTTFIEIEHDFRNRFDVSKASENKYIDNAGLPHNGNGLLASDFIPVEEGKTYYVYRIYVAKYAAFYDENKNVLQTLTSSWGTHIGSGIYEVTAVPRGASFIRFTVVAGDENICWMNEVAKAPTGNVTYSLADNISTDEKNTYCEYDGMDVCAFTKCVCIGDSLTAGTMNYRVGDSTANYIGVPEKSYPSYFARLTNMKVTNLGHGGATSAEWWNMEKDSDLSGHDMAIIQLGVNDKARYGDSWTSTSQTAFTNIVNKLKAENQNIKIFVATIVPAIAYGSDAISQGIRDFVSGLNDPNVILVDLAVHGHTADRTDYNCGHLSAYGYWRLARDYVAYISYIMANDTNDVFREIQFIGTDYQYHA